MPAYCWICNVCGATSTTTELPEGIGFRCVGWYRKPCPALLRRDWKAEGANVSIENLKQEREGK